MSSRGWDKSALIGAQLPKRQPPEAGDPPLLGPSNLPRASPAPWLAWGGPQAGVHAVILPTLTRGVGPLPHLRTQAQAPTAMSGVQDTHTRPTGPFWVIVPKKILCLKKNLRTKKKNPKHNGNDFGLIYHNL